MRLLVCLPLFVLKLQKQGWSCLNWNACHQTTFVCRSFLSFWFLSALLTFKLLGADHVVNFMFLDWRSVMENQRLIMLPYLNDRGCTNSWKNLLNLQTLFSSLLALKVLNITSFKTFVLILTLLYIYLFYFIFFLLVHFAGYARPLVDKIDRENLFSLRLYRPSTVST